MTAIPLPPGAYVLHPANLTGSVLPTAEPTPFNVRPHTFTTVTVSFDSGIRSAARPVAARRPRPLNALALPGAPTALLGRLALARAWNPLAD